MKAIIVALLLLLPASSLLRAQTTAPPVTEPVATGWRKGLLTDIPAAFDIAKKQRGGVLVCFSGDFLADTSFAAQVFQSKKIGEWAAEKKLTLALIEYPRPGAPDPEEAKARFYELTRQFKIAGWRTWVVLDATGRELGRFSKEDVFRSDNDGNVVNRGDLDIWLQQAERAINGQPPQLLEKPASPKETWYARFGGKGWTGKRTVSGAEGAMNYTLFTPANLLSGKKYPLLIWLHGGGSSSGDEIADADAVGLSASASDVGSEKFLLVPSAPVRQVWRGPRLSGASSATGESSPAVKFIVRLVDSLPNTCNIDRSRVIVMGESGGAFGSWLLLQSFPDRFLGGIINSGGGDATKVDALLKKRIWIFHGEKDEIVPIARDQEMFEALMRSRGQRPHVVTEGDWVKASDNADTIRFWKHTQSGHVPAVDYKAAINWVLAPP